MISALNILLPIPASTKYLLVLEHTIQYSFYNTNTNMDTNTSPYDEKLSSKYNTGPYRYLQPFQDARDISIIFSM